VEVNAQPATATHLRIRRRRRVRHPACGRGSLARPRGGDPGLPTLPPRRGALGARTDVGLPAPVRGRGDRPVSVHVAVPAPKRGRNPSRGPANLAATPRRTGHWRTHPARPTRAGCRAGMPAVSRRGRIGAPTDVRWRRPNSRAGAGLSRTAGLPRTPLPRRQPGRGYVVPSSPVWSPLSPRPA